MNTRQVRIGTVPDLARKFAGSIGPLVTEAVATRGRWTLAIPGGSAMEALLPVLSRGRLPWGRCHVLWCDERAVPPSDPESNWGAFHAMDGIDAIRETATCHRMPADAPDERVAAAAYADEIIMVAGNPPILDVVLLGIGEDGHVASLFAGHTAARETTRLVVVEHQAPKPPPHRMSLALPVLAGARLTCLAAFGATKQRALRSALDPNGTTPAAQLVREAANLLVLADAEAGVGLSNEG